MNKFYITTTLPYVNADPHIGFALELIQADVIARHHRYILNEDVVFNTGTDEHGVKIYTKALESGKDPQEYVDEYAQRFKMLVDVLNISATNFIRTSDKKHKETAQKFWQKCIENGDIYKTKYKIKYCIGCELEKTDSEIENGKCPIHPNLKIEDLEEENYFFKFSKFKKPLLEFYKKNPEFVLPKYRFNEIIKFVEEGPRDFSVSRLKEKMPWGVSIPSDETQVMYVWFDALINYISTLGWPDDARFSEFWPGIQIAGKDNLRQQSAIWQAMLMSAGVENSKQVLIHGFVTADGQKMSKSLGNVIDPFSVAEKYGVDVLRYYLLREIPSGEDGDFSEKKLEERYNGELANGLGNLVQRVITIIDSKMDGELVFSEKLLEGSVKDEVQSTKDKVLKNIDGFILHEALGDIWKLIGFANRYADDKAPWNLIKNDEKGFISAMTNLTFIIYEAAIILAPFMPQTSAEILERIGVKSEDKLENNFEVRVLKSQPLFPRLK